MKVTFEGGHSFGPSQDPPPPETMTPKNYESHFKRSLAQSEVAPLPPSFHTMKYHISMTPPAFSFWCCTAATPLPPNYKILKEEMNVLLHLTPSLPIHYTTKANMNTTARKSPMKTKL